jgi:hypothetical protein
MNENKLPKIPRNLINAARSHHALFELARKFGRGDRTAELFADHVTKAREARNDSNRDHIGFGVRKQAYQKGKQI